VYSQLQLWFFLRLEHNQRFELPFLLGFLRTTTGLN